MKSSSDASLGSQDIIDFGLRVEPEWHGVDMRPGADGDWANAVVTELFPEPSDESWRLRVQLAGIQRNLLEWGMPDLSAAAWIPTPATGSAACVAAFGLASKTPGETVDDYFDELKSAVGTKSGDGQVLTVDTWRGRIDVGEFVASRDIIDKPDVDDEQGVLVERITFAVFPDDARQAVIFNFTAENIAAVDDLPAVTQQFVSTLYVELGAAA